MKYQRGIETSIEITKNHQNERRNPIKTLENLDN